MCLLKTKCIHHFVYYTWLESVSILLLVFKLNGASMTTFLKGVVSLSSYILEIVIALYIKECLNPQTRNLFLLWFEPALYHAWLVTSYLSGTFECYIKSCFLAGDLRQ